METEKTMNLKELIASNIVILMNIYGKDRKQVCKDLDFSYTTFCDWVNARTYPRMEALEKLGFYFRIDSRDFFIEIEQNEGLLNRLSTYASLYGVNLGHDAGEEITAEKYYETPEGYPVELLNGKFAVLEAPSVRHQSIVAELSFAFRKYIKDKGGNCRVFPGPVDVELPTGKPNVLQPDVTVICDGNKIEGKRIKGTPDLVVEVLSNKKHRDKIEKLLVYEEAGVKEYWIVDPDKNETTVYYRSNEKEDDRFVFEDPVCFGFGDEIPVQIYGGNLKIRFEDMDLV